MAFVIRTKRDLFCSLVAFDSPFYEFSDGGWYNARETFSHKLPAVTNGIYFEFRTHTEPQNFINDFYIRPYFYTCLYWNGKQRYEIVKVKDGK